MLNLGRSQFWRISNMSRLFREEWIFTAPEKLILSTSYNVYFDQWGNPSLSWQFWKIQWQQPYQHFLEFEWTTVCLFQEWYNDSLKRIFIMACSASQKGLGQHDCLMWISLVILLVLSLDKSSLIHRGQAGWRQVLQYMFTGTDVQHYN